MSHRNKPGGFGYHRDKLQNKAKIYKPLKSKGHGKRQFSRWPVQVWQWPMNFSRLSMRCDEWGHCGIALTAVVLIRRKQCLFTWNSCFNSSEKGGVFLQPCYICKLTLKFMCRNLNIFKSALCKLTCS